MRKLTGAAYVTEVRSTDVCELSAGRRLYRRVRTAASIAPTAGEDLARPVSSAKKLGHSHPSVPQSSAPTDCARPISTTMWAHTGRQPDAGRRPAVIDECDLDPLDQLRTTLLAGNLKLR